MVYGAFSRRWIAGGGVGHVFESTNGGTTWTDRSGNLPDAPVNDIVVFKGQLVVGTDVGVFGTSASSPGSWARIGKNLPNASTNDLTVAPSGKYLLAGTHGRGHLEVHRLSRIGRLPSVGSATALGNRPPVLWRVTWGGWILADAGSGLTTNGGLMNQTRAARSAIVAVAALALAALGARPAAGRGREPEPARRP